MPRKHIGAIAAYSCETSELCKTLLSVQLSQSIKAKACFHAEALLQLPLSHRLPLLVLWHNLAYTCSPGRTLATFSCCLNTLWVNVRTQ